MRGIAQAMALTCTVAMACAADDNGPTVVWWEAEDAVEHNFPARTSFSPHTFADRRDQLSGGEWLTSEGKLTEAPRFARYTVDVPAAGEYDLWVRKFWKHGPFRWRFGENEDWSICGRDVALFDGVTLRTHLSANWVHLGRVQLAAGAARFEVELLAGVGDDGVGAFDCFVLARGSFLPRGRLKPGERLTAAEDGYFAYDPGLDPFTGEALLDLRGLNEPTAGQAGFLRRDGDRITLGDGAPVRFWAVNIGPAVFEQPDVALDYLARRLAKQGVNMVRLHGAIFDDRDPTRVNPARLNGMQRTVAAMRRQGIYTTLSPFFPVWMTVTPSCELEGYDTAANKKPFAILFFNERMQALHRHWLRELLTAPNPHTDLPLGSDPAVGMVEIVNEDSLFFWTFSKGNVPPPQWSDLERRFGTWLIARHGSLDAAFRAWGERPGRGDDIRAGRAEVFEAWHMTRQGVERANAARRKRISDQITFLTELQRGFYDSATRFMRHDLGYRGLIVASNWTTADNKQLDALERYSYTPADVIDFHGYMDRAHEGEGAAWSVRTGHLFNDVTTLGSPGWAPIRIDQLAGYPSILSEVNWTNPSGYRAEGTAILAAYGALQGIDGIYFFAVNNPMLLNQGLDKFALGDAATIGTFPAAALLYRRGDVQQGDAVVHQALQLTDLYALRGQATGGGDAPLDAFRAADVPPGAVLEGDAGEFDGHAWFVGRVMRSVGVAGDRSRWLNTASLIRRDAKQMTSVTGELSWDWGRRVIMIDTPRCRAAVGFLREHGPVALGDVTIVCDNDYAAIFVIALDDLPLAESRRVLVQAMTRERFHGLRTEPAKNDKGEDRLRITSLGSPPLNVERIAATVTLPGGPWRATALDALGYAREELPVATGPLQLPTDTLYTLFTR
jgi:hypothetical protein